MEHLDNIQKLLDRYWEGETTLEEERQLKSYFQSPNVDERFLRFAPLFRVLEQDKKLEWHNTKVIPMEHSRRLSFRTVAAAASVALLIGAGLWWTLSPTPPAGTVATTGDAPKVKDTVPTLAERTPAEQSTAAVIAPPRATQKVSIKYKKPRKNNQKPAQSATEVVLDAETEQALLEVKAAFALLGSKLSKGKNEANKGATHLDQVERIFKKKVNQSQG